MRKGEKEEILAGPEGRALLENQPHPEALAKEELVAFHLEIPGFPEWRRYYWTDKSLWGNRGYVIGGPEQKLELVVQPEMEKIFADYGSIVEELRTKLTEAVQPTDTVVIIEEPVYDQRRAFEEQELARQKGLTTEHAVKKGESLWLISGYPEVYGNPLEWPALYEANRDKILDPNLIYPGQSFRIPRSMDSLASGEGAPAEGALK